MRPRPRANPGIAHAARTALVALCGVAMLPWQSSAQQVSVQVEPSLVLGGSAGAPELARVRSAELTKAGFVVADVRAPALLLYDAQGRFVRSLGRKGRGPGEYTAPMWVGTCGSDSLFAWDAREFIFTVFSASGEFVRNFRSPIGGVMPGCSVDADFAVLLFPRRIEPPDPASPVQPKGTMRLLNSTTDSTGTVSDLSMDGRVFGPMTTFAWHRRELYVSSTDEPRVDVFDRQGNRVRSIALRLRKRPVAAAEHEVFVDRMLDEMRIKGDARAQQRAAFLSMPVPEHHPAFRDLRIAPNGTMWVNEEWPEDGAIEGRLRAFTLDGKPLGEARLKRPIRLLNAGNDYLLGAFEGDEGAPRVGLFRVTRGR